MLIYSMTVSADGFVTDRHGGIDWTAPTDDKFDKHLEEVRGLGAYLLGRRLYEGMRVWETDPRLRETAAHRAFADAWTALPKVVFSRTLARVDGNARLAQTSLADEIVATLGATGDNVSIGGASLAAQAIELGLVDEMRMFRAPVIVGGEGTPYFPPVDRVIPLQLVETSTLSEGVVYERYRRVG